MKQGRTSCGVNGFPWVEFFAVARGHRTEGFFPVMYNQMIDGSLQLQGRFPTGGSGSGNLPTGGRPDPLGSQGPLVAAGDFLLTVSALSGEVAVFRIEEFGLDRTSVVSLGD